MRFVLFIGVIIMGCALGGCATTFHAGAGKGAINVIGHRGASAYAPENTLASYALAKELGADYFELDCMLSRDDEVVIFHDDKLDRVTNGVGLFAEKTLAELKQLDAGSWKDPKFKGEKIPTLAEALDLAREKKSGVYCEIKTVADDSALLQKVFSMTEGQTTLSPERRREVMRIIRESGSRNVKLTGKVIALLRERHMKHQVVIQSFSPIIVAAVLDMAPEFQTEQLALKDDENPQRFPMFLRWAALMQPGGFNPSLEVVTEDLVRQMHARGTKVNVWTVDEEADMRRLAEWGVDGIISNKPDVVLSVLKSLKKHP